MNSVEKLPLAKQFAYATGQLGWATLVNIINLQLVYFYIPPSDSGIPTFITQVVFLAVLNTLTIVAASGRLLDAFTDPIIANLSDRWKGKRGRRIPFLLFGAIPTAICCTLMFIPIVNGESAWNIAWLILVQSLFYVFLTIYVTPFFALLPELGHTSRERLNLSTWISITYALGIIMGALVPSVAEILTSALEIPDKVTALQWSIGVISGIAAVFMLIPVFFIDESRYCRRGQSEIPLLKAVQNTFRNKNFIYYVVADFSYFMGETIIMTGLLYYITVLLELADSYMAALLPLMVLISFFFYPLVNMLAHKFGKKLLVTGAFWLMSVLFFFVYFLGNLPFSNLSQAYALIMLCAIPISFLGILPNAVLADIAEHDAITTGVSQEGMFFAARTLMQKFGMTFGVLVFAALTSLGKDPGDDLGIRLSGFVGCALCLFAGLYFLKYDEKRLLKEMGEERM